jgi:ubiquinol-cytochrome c reductase cytochrome b subunit
VGVVVALHVILIRAKGVVPPIDAADTDAQLVGTKGEIR